MQWICINGRNFFSIFHFIRRKSSQKAPNTYRLKCVIDGLFAVITRNPICMAAGRKMLHSKNWNVSKNAKLTSNIRVKYNGMKYLLEWIQCTTIFLDIFNLYYRYIIQCVWKPSLGMVEFHKIIKQTAPEQWTSMIKFLNELKKCVACRNYFETLVFATLPNENACKFK